MTICRNKSIILIVKKDERGLAMLNMGMTIGANKGLLVKVESFEAAKAIVNGTEKCVAAVIAEEGTNNHIATYYKGVWH